MSVVSPYTPAQAEAWRRRTSAGVEPIVLPMEGWTCTTGGSLPNEHTWRYARGEARVVLTRYWDRPLTPGGPMVVASQREVRVGSEVYEVVSTSRFEGVAQRVEVVFFRGSDWSARLTFTHCEPETVDAVLAQVQRTPPKGATRSGAAIVGAQVTLRSMDFALPTSCAVCLRAAETKLVAQKRLAILRRSIPIPYCGPCAQRTRAAQRRRALAAWVTVLLAPMYASLGYLVPALPLVWLGVSTVVLSVSSAIVVLSKRRLGVDPVVLAAFRAFTSVLWCESAEWAGQLARANGLVPEPRPAPRTTTRRLIATGLFGLAAALGVWLTAHTPVFVDHAGAVPIQIWLDGRAVAIVAPRTRWQRPPWFFASHGQHTLGASPPGAHAPASTLDVEILRGRAHLYNPGATACYAVATFQPSLQPIAEFYRFDRAAIWFVHDGETELTPAVRAPEAPLEVERDLPCMNARQHAR